MYDFQVYYLKAHLNYSMSEIEDLPVRTGVQYLHNFYDESMQNKIAELSMHGIDVKDATQCGVEYKMWMHRKKYENKPDKEDRKIEVSPEYAKRMKEHTDREINRVVGKRMLK